MEKIRQLTQDIDTYVVTIFLGIYLNLELTESFLNPFRQMNLSTKKSSKRKFWKDGQQGLAMVRGKLLGKISRISTLAKW